MDSTSVRDGPRRRGRVGVEDGELVARRPPGTRPRDRSRARSGTGSRPGSGPGKKRSATPSRSARSPQASFGSSASACSTSAERTSAGITTRGGLPWTRRPRRRGRVQKSAERYFQPPSARTATTTPSSSSSRDPAGDVDDGARGDAGEDRLALEQQAQPLDRLLVGHEHLPVELGDVEDRRDVAVRQRAQAVDEVALERLGRGHDQIRERLPEPVPGAHEGAAGAETGDEGVDLREGVGDLGARPLVVRAGIGLVSVLEGHEPARVPLGHLQREPHRAVRALGGRGEDDLRAVELEQLDALGGGVLGQDAGQRVALEPRDERERDARVAAGRLQQLAAGLELAGGLGRLDHRLGDAVLDRAGRVLALELRVEANAVVRGQARELDERRRADRLEHGRA